MASREHFLSLLTTNSLEKPFINYFSTEKTGLSITRRDFLALTVAVENLLSKSLGGRFEFVGVQLNDYLWLPCLLTGIWRSGKACACVGTQYSKDCNLNFLNALHVKYLITDNEKSCFTADLVETFQINGQPFNIWKMKSDSAANMPNKPLDICYGIMTSGSTGSPKIIQVPWSCILPNVYELIHLFSVNEDDNVYLSSPYTFDPFFVELFMSFISCCTLTIVSPQLKISSEVLLKIFFENHECTFNMNNWKDFDTSLLCKTSTVMQSPVTVIQMTPSIFKRWSLSKIRDIVLSEKSSLRILLLGGEKFPSDLLKFKSNGNKTQIFNIYGITEISCWAFVSSVIKNHDDIPLGCPLNDIVYNVDENNELHIGSNKRRCLIDGEKNVETTEIVFRKTGDLVLVKNSEIYYISRTNQIVKKFGIKINLEKIENIFVNAHKEQCFCVFDESTMKLALFYSNDELKEEYRVTGGQKKIGLPLASIEVPDYIIEIPNAPLNSNGKCDKGALLQLFKDIMRKERVEDLGSSFERVWAGIVGERNFVVAGGDSVLALQMITRLKDAGIEVSKTFLPTLLTDGDYDNCLNCVSKNYILGNKRIKLQTDEKSFNFAILWTFDMWKCVDAPPTVFHRNGEVHAVVGSHSSRLSSVKVATGQENWTINLSGRIESGFSVNKSSTFGVIGCYDQHVYCLSTSDGQILWKYKTGGMIKSTPCLSSNEENVYVASYDTYLYCLNCQDGTVIRRIKLSDRGVYSSGIVSDELGSFFVGTLDGSCISLSQESNEIYWKHRLPNPIFASPVLANSNPTVIFVIFAEVTGQLSCFNARTGTQVWRFECGGCIYSTPVYSSSFNFLVFPCYDNHLYCLKFSDEPSIEWKTHLDSPGFAKPCLFSITDTWLITVASTKGWIYLIQLKSGSTLGQVKLNGEIFSSPNMNLDNLIVGCRDNNLYCLKIEMPSG